MIAALILHVCLGAFCKDEPAHVEVTFAECTYLGQIIAQDWLADHPKWELRGWRCKVGGGRDG